MSIRELREAVEAGTASMDDFAAVFPSETAYGPTTWGEAHKAYNGSLDAAKRLHDALLPGWEWGRTEGNIFVRNPFKARWNVFWGGPNQIDARSFLLAILRAMEGR